MPFDGEAVDYTATISDDRCTWQKYFKGFLVYSATILGGLCLFMFVNHLVSTR